MRMLNRVATSRKYHGIFDRQSVRGKLPGKGYKLILRLNMKVNCQEHRKSMELLSLKRQLGKGISDPRELENIKERIKTLEKELKID